MEGYGESTMIYIRCDECKQLFGASLPMLPSEPGQPEDYPGDPAKIIHALGAYGETLERYPGFTNDGVVLREFRVMCPPCRQAAEERGGVVT